MDAFRRCIDPSLRLACLLGLLAPIAACTGPAPTIPQLPSEHIMDESHPAPKSPDDPLLRLLASLDSADQLTPDWVGATLGVQLKSSAATRRANGDVPLGDAGRAAVSLYPDVLDDSRRRMLVEFIPHAGAAAACTVGFERLASGLQDAGYRRLPRGSAGEPEPTSFVRGPIVIELALSGPAAAGDADACVRQLVVR